ncbi:uncharacterized acetyltransferase At3g50280-like [Pyrus x bretschneideri]|uniref:uncharacterized acetyltransferase At3g50280-like n=1 Tax=Pyrus x bretschneideri TaxID=225117 RepID=UPI00202EFC6D|nr:uncharacterized acetyltransferase At3g50280-like [Pyrus x bretschneideri]
MDSPNVERISECFVQPHHASEESDKPFYLTPGDLAMLSVHHIQKGLLFYKPPEAKRDPKNFTDSLLERLKQSLSVALGHFYPLTGRLVTKKSEDPALYLVYVDFNNSPGAKFIYATLDMSIPDILSPTDVPLVVQSFFDHDRVLDHDGHTMSLLTIQVTELVDGIVIGPSLNHCLGDGTSFWHFFNICVDANFRLLLLEQNCTYKTINTLGESRLVANNRARINPPLSGEYCGNSIYPVISETVAAGELLEHGFGWAAWKLHEAVVNHNDKVIRELLDAWLKSPAVYQVSYFDPFSIMMGGSPRFNMYGNEFGMGKGIAL